MPFLGFGSRVLVSFNYLHCGELLLASNPNLSGCLFGPFPLTEPSGLRCLLLSLSSTPTGQLMI